MSKFQQPTQDENELSAGDMPLMSHLVELRDRVLKICYGVFGVFALLVFFANPIYTTITAPLRSYLPEGTSMIATGAFSPFLTPLKLVLFLSFYIALPWVLYQAWAFIAPGLYKQEKKLVLPLVVSSTLLFYTGMAFAFFVVLPLFSSFMSSTTPEGTAWMPDIHSFLSFLLTMFFAFGVAFEVPIATILLCRAGVTSPEKLRSQRPYIFIIAFVIGMLLTPPDIISQTLLAVPMLVLFEIGVFVAAAIEKNNADSASQDSNPAENLSDNTANSDDP